MRLVVEFDVTDRLAALLESLTIGTAGSQIMSILEKLQVAVDETHNTGEAARAAIVRVAEDVTEFHTDIDELHQMIVDLQAKVDAGATAGAELEALKADLAEAEAMAADIKDAAMATGESLRNLDPIPPAPVVEPPVEEPPTV